MKRNKFIVIYVFLCDTSPWHTYLILVFYLYVFMRQKHPWTLFVVRIFLAYILFILCLLVQLNVFRCKFDPKTPLMSWAEFGANLNGLGLSFQPLVVPWFYHQQNQMTCKINESTCLHDSLWTWSRDFEAFGGGNFGKTKRNWIKVSNQSWENSKFQNYVLRVSSKSNKIIHYQKSHEIGNRKRIEQLPRKLQN